MSTPIFEIESRQFSSSNFDVSSDVNFIIEMAFSIVLFVVTWDFFHKRMSEYHLNFITEIVEDFLLIPLAGFS